MSLAADDQPYRVTFEQFLAFEADAPVRHEYLGGVAYAMAGGTRVHNQIAGRIYSAVLAEAGSRGCRAYINDVLLRVGADAFYPDVMVVCTDPVDARFEVEPCLVVEVLSPTTERYDRTTKHAAYTSLESVDRYVLVSGDPADQWVEVFRRAGDLWFRDRLGPGDTLHLGCVEVALAVTEIFAGVV